MIHKPANEEGLLQVVCILNVKVAEFRCVCSELLSKGRQWDVTWRTTGREWVLVLGRFSWHGDAN